MWPGLLRVERSRAAAQKPQEPHSQRLASCRVSLEVACLGAYACLHAVAKAEDGRGVDGAEVVRPGVAEMWVADVVGAPGRAATQGSHAAESSSGRRLGVCRAAAGVEVPVALDASGAAAAQTLGAMVRGGRGALEARGGGGGRVRRGGAAWAVAEVALLAAAAPEAAVPGLPPQRCLQCMTW